MPGCRQCGKQWPEGYSMCPEDGQPLQALAAGSTIATSPGGALPALAANVADDLAPGSLCGEYQIERKIGEGGMGSVYGARHPLIGKRAAIKVISRELSASAEGVDRFVLEAQAVNQIGHENIVDVFGFGRLPDGRSFFVMEWLQGESLRSRLERPMPFLEAVEILETVAKALQAAHEAGVLHRDLKPDNVYLEAVKGEKPRVKLLDFGLAKLSGSGDGAGHDRTRTGVVMGTPLYLSPEQAKGAKVDFATDVYSLGAIAYEMFTGAVPFRADSAVEIMAMHISQPIVPLAQVAPQLPPQADRLVTMMMMKEPRARPSSGVVRQHLAALRALPMAAMIGPPPSTLPIGAPTWTPAAHAPQTSPEGPRALTAPTALQPASAASAIHDSAIVGPRGSRRWLVIALLAVFGAGLGVALFLAFGRPSDKRGGGGPVVAAQGSDVAQPAVAKPEVAKPEVAKPEVAKPEVAKPEVAKPEVAKPAPAKPPPAKPVATTGKLSITVVGPVQPRIVVDGRPAGKQAGGKLVLDVAAGDHTILVQSKSFKSASTKVHVDAGATREVKLAPEPRRTVNDAPDPFDE